MTAIIAIRRGDGAISMGSDRRVTWSEGHAMRMSEPKMFHVGKFLVGAAGSCAPGQVLQEWEAAGRKMPPKPKAMDWRTYLRTKFTPMLRRALEQAGQEGDGEWAALFAIDGRLFVIDGEGMSVDEIDGPYVAIGCGRYLAMGAAHALLEAWGCVQSKPEAELAIKIALTAAEKHDTRCGDGMDIWHQDAP